MFKTEYKPISTMFYAIYLDQYYVLIPLESHLNPQVMLAICVVHVIE